MEVGVRALKSRLSEVLAQVVRGEDVVVTDRGRPIVRLVPYAGQSPVEQGIEQGWIEPARRSSLPEVARVRSEMSSTRALEEDRG